MPKSKKVRSSKMQMLAALGALVFLLCAAPMRSSAGVAISITVAPPVLPVYVQPACPAEGYIWTPGYWAWGPAGYYWVPGVWVQPPRVGLLWTPGYWGFGSGVYAWHSGYWGPRVGFYGGVHYGFGYTGVGFAGGYWAGSVFRYNTAVTRVNTTVIRNVYVDRTVIRNTTIVNRVSYNGPGGIRTQPGYQERMAMREQHFQPTQAQFAHRQTAGENRYQLASYNHGRPPVASMDRINGRRYNQQARIANGVSSGQLTPGETRNLERREANMNRQVHSDRQANGGRLTPQERQQFNQRQNNMNRSIYQDKHNGAGAHYGNSEVGQRRYEQQQRIGQGIRSGQMAPGEAARAENRERNINHQVNTERRANEGRLTPGERRQVNREQNHASREIRQEKHNERTAPQ